MPPPLLLQAPVQISLERLYQAYGKPRANPHRRPLDELVLAILSQNTNDANRDVAYLRLRAALPTWAAVAAAPVSQVEEAIRPGGISRIKSKRIQAILHTLGDPPSLDWLADVDRLAAREFLLSLPDVGSKTAACVLLFSYGYPDIPVDTHISRVGRRLGWFPAKATWEQLHLLANQLCADGNDAWAFHVALIRHGRRTCTAKAPACHRCPLQDICPSANRRLVR